MKKEEIRIGNWAYDPIKKQNGKVVAIEYSKLGRPILDIGSQEKSYTVSFSGCDCIKPIPLTSDILEKAGLKPKRLLGHTIKYNIEGDSEATGELLIIKESIGYVAAVGRKGSIVVLNVIRHLHQLQNIYFFLSGTELKIQP